MGNPHSVVTEFHITNQFSGQGLQPLKGESLTLSSLELHSSPTNVALKESIQKLSLFENPMDIVSKFIVHGYAHQIQPLLFQTIVPEAILHLILLNYQYKYPRHASFNDIKFSNCLTFNNRSTVTKTTHNGYGSCLFGTPITDKVCRKYSITIQLNSLSKGFMMGYGTCISGVHYNAPLGQDSNKYNSVGIYVWMNENRLELYDTNDMKKLKYEYQSVFDKHSVFKLEFDFGRDRLTVYHRYERGQKISLNGCKLLIPAFTLFDEYDSLRIVKWKRRRI